MYQSYLTADVAEGAHGPLQLDRGRHSRQPRDSEVTNYTGISPTLSISGFTRLAPDLIIGILRAETRSLELLFSKTEALGKPGRGCGSDG